MRRPAGDQGERIVLDVARIAALIDQPNKLAWWWYRMPEELDCEIAAEIRKRLAWRVRVLPNDPTQRPNIDNTGSDFAGLCLDASQGRTSQLEPALLVKVYALIELAREFWGLKPIGWAIPTETTYRLREAGLPTGIGARRGAEAEALRKAVGANLAAGTKGV